MCKLNSKIKNLYKASFIESKYYLVYSFTYENVYEFIYLLYELFIARQVRINRIKFYNMNLKHLRFNNFQQIYFFLLKLKFFLAVLRFGYQNYGLFFYVFR